MIFDEYVASLNKLNNSSLIDDILHYCQIENSISSSA